MPKSKKPSAPRPKIGWKQPRSIEPHADIVRNGNSWRWTEFKRFRNTHHYGHLGDGNAYARARSGSKWVNSVHPEVLLYDGSEHGFQFIPFAASPDWFVPIFGGWDGVRDAVLVLTHRAGCIQPGVLAEALAVDVRLVERALKAFSEAGLLTLTRHGYTLETRAPWSAALSRLLQARSGHFAINIEAKPAPALSPSGFKFSLDALRKVVQGSAAYTVALVSANLKPYCALQGIVADAGMSMASVRAAVNDLVGDGLLVPCRRGKSVVLHAVRCLKYAHEIENFCEALGVALGIHASAPGSYDEQFRCHIHKKQILTNRLWRTEVRKTEAEDFFKFPPDEYTALVTVLDEKSDGEDLGWVRTFDWQPIAPAELGPVERNGGFGGRQRTVYFEVPGKFAYRGKAYTYRTKTGGRSYYAHLRRVR